MKPLQRQICWLGWFILLLLATWGTLFDLFQHVSLVRVLLPFLLTYGWVRFVVSVWPFLYRGQVSPGWCVALLFAAFGIFFLLPMMYEIARGHAD